MRALAPFVVLLAACARPAPGPDVVQAWPLVQGSIGGGLVGWHVAFTNGKGVQLCRLEDGEGLPCQDLDGFSATELLTMDAGTWSARSTFYLTARSAGTISAALLADAKYVEQLVVGSRAPAEAERGWDHELVGLALTLSADEAAAWAVANREDDALYERFRHHQPMGSCSQDGTPERAARLHAELALARGDMPTFVDLQLRLLADHFNRVAWSSFGHEKQATFAERLAQKGVDVDRLLMGLVIQYPGRTATPDDLRLARAIKEAGRAEVLLPRLEALAVRGDLDIYNRFRATEVWLHLQLGPEPTKERVDTVKALGRKLALEPLSRARLESAREASPRPWRVGALLGQGKAGLDGGPPPTD